MDWISLLAAAVTGLGSGVVGSLIAPWVQLAVEKRREQAARRRTLLDGWYDMLAEHAAFEDQQAVLSDARFIQLRPHRGNELLAELESPRRFMVDSMHPVWLATPT